MKRGSRFGDSPYSIAPKAAWDVPLRKVAGSIGNQKIGDAWSRVLSLDLTETAIDKIHAIFDTLMSDFFQRTITLDSGVMLHRARLAEERPGLVRDVGMPPKGKVGYGRVNTPGHPVLYLAESRDVALSEIGAEPGQHVALSTWAANSRSDACDSHLQLDISRIMSSLRGGGPLRDSARQHQGEQRPERRSGYPASDVGKGAFLSDEAEMCLTTLPPPGVAGAPVPRAGARTPCRSLRRGAWSAAGSHRYSKLPTSTIIKVETPDLRG